MHSSVRMSSTTSRGRRVLIGSLCAALTGLALGTLPVTPAAGVTDPVPAFEVTASDLSFILKQIKISEAHANDGNLLCPTTTDTSGTCVPDPILPWGLRTVTGVFNNILPGKGANGSADRPFPRLTGDYGWPGEGAGSGTFDLDGPGPSPASSVTSTGYGDANVVDGDPRMISNLIVDQTTSKPGRRRSGQPRARLGGARGRVAASSRTGHRTRGCRRRTTPWFTLFGQFFDHGLDIVNKGGNGTVVVPLAADDPLYRHRRRAEHVRGLPAGLRSMSRTPTVIGVDASGRQHNNQTTPFVDQNQTYTSHPSHQVFLREYDDATGRPRGTGRLLDGGRGGLATWTETKQLAREILGIVLDDMDILNVPRW